MPTQIQDHEMRLRLLERSVYQLDWDMAEIKKARARRVGVLLALSGVLAAWCGTVAAIVALVVGRH